MKQIQEKEKRRTGSISQYLHGNDVSRALLPRQVNLAELALAQTPPDLEVAQGPASPSAPAPAGTAAPAAVAATAGHHGLGTHLHHVRVERSHIGHEIFTQV